MRILMSSRTERPSERWRSLIGNHRKHMNVFTSVSSVPLCLKRIYTSRGPI